MQAFVNYGESKNKKLCVRLILHTSSDTFSTSCVCVWVLLSPLWFAFRSVFTVNFNELWQHSLNFPLRNNHQYKIHAFKYQHIHTRVDYFEIFAESIVFNFAIGNIIGKLPIFRYICQKTVMPTNEYKPVCICVREKRGMKTQSKNSKQLFVSVVMRICYFCVC